MFATLSLRHPRRAASLLVATLLIGCSDTPGPVAPLAPGAPNAQVGSVLIVTNTDDAGPGSLRQAVLDAVDGDVIQFDASIGGQTIALTSGELLIDKILTIEGPLASGITISGSFLSRVFSVDSVLTARNLSIVNGLAPVNGGGILVNSRAILEHVLVANNQATNDGGGIYVAGGSAELTLLNSTVTGNTGDFGGGITANNLVTIRNSTISQNIASKAGGGIQAHKATLSIRNSIVAENVDVGGGEIENNCWFESTSTVAPAGANLSDDDSCGAGFSVGEPGLGPLANNGGPTSTQALLFGSNAIDLGTACTESTDQRYAARPQGASCDVGAYEFDSFRNISLTISPNVAVNPKTGVATVTGTISCPGYSYSPLRVTLNQTQKTRGKFTTIIQAQADLPAITCASAPSSWSVALTPAMGTFAPGTATGSASVTSAPAGYVPANVTSPVKLFQVK